MHAPDAAARLSDAIAGRRARVAVLGLGYAGLPLAEAFLRAGFPVLGLDIDRGRIEALHRGISYIGHIPDERIREMTASGRFEPTAEPGRLAEAEALLICVPTPLAPNREPDLSAVRAASQAVAATLRPGQLVVLESTTYPGTTRDVVLPILAQRGLRLGEDFFLAYSPEREDPGNRRYTTVSIPRVVGGVEEASGRLAAQLYSAVLERVVPVRSAEVAEASKILENTYRAVNIALVNELKVLYDRMGIDIWEVIDAASTKPFGFQPFYPGPGLGGHCIPIDPFYLAWAARQVGCPARFVELAGEINRAMPGYVIGKLEQALQQRGQALHGAQVALLGLAYKKDVEDVRESPGVELLVELARRGATVVYNDPHVPAIAADERHPALVSQPLSEDWLSAQDAVVIVTDHSVYDWDLIAGAARLLVDTRNATRNVRGRREHIVRA